MEPEDYIKDLNVLKRKVLQSREILLKFCRSKNQLFPVSCLMFEAADK